MVMTMVRYDAMMRHYKGDSAMPQWYDDDDDDDGDDDDDDDDEEEEEEEEKEEEGCVMFASLHNLAITWIPLSWLPIYHIAYYVAFQELWLMQHSCFADISKL